jgi:P2-related tail formation protein
MYALAKSVDAWEVSVTEALGREVIKSSPALTLVEAASIVIVPE